MLKTNSDCNLQMKLLKSYIGKPIKDAIYALEILDGVLKANELRHEINNIKDKLW